MSNHRVYSKGELRTDLNVVEFDDFGDSVFEERIITPNDVFNMDVLELGKGFKGFDSQENLFVEAVKAGSEERETDQKIEEERTALADMRRLAEEAAAEDRRRAIEELQAAMTEAELLREAAEGVRVQGEEMREQAQAMLEETRRQVEVERLRTEALFAEKQEKAREIVSRAQERGEEIVDKAKRRGDTIEANAYQAGFGQGEEAGKRLSDQKNDAVVRRLLSTIDEVLAQRDGFLQGQEALLTKLALAIGLQVVHREIQLDPTVVLDIVRKAISRVKNATKLTVCVSPFDFRFIEDHSEEIQTVTDSGTEILIEPDDSVARGGCLIKSDNGVVDAAIDSMVMKMLEKLRVSGPTQDVVAEVE